MFFDFASFLPRAVMQGIPLLYGSTGEILTEKSGNLNLGIPGIMYVGGICGVIGAFFYEQAVPAAEMNGLLAVGIPMLCSPAWLPADGAAVLLPDRDPAGQSERHRSGHDHLRRGRRQLLRRLPDQAHRQRGALHRPVRYQCLLQQIPPLRREAGGVWADVPVLWIPGVSGYCAGAAGSYFLKHTRAGLHLRAVGESASTADAAGINVTKYKYLATCIGSMIAGLGGLYYVMDYASGVWSNNAFGDRGWLAIALVIFTIWRPNVSVLASILFGGFYILYLYIPTGTNLAIKELFYKMLPYVVTLAVLIIVSLRRWWERGASAQRPDNGP